MAMYLRKIVEVIRTEPATHFFGAMRKKTFGHYDIKLECGHTLKRVYAWNIQRQYKRMSCEWCEAGEEPQDAA